MRTLKDRAAVVGIGWTNYSRASGKSVEELAVEAARNAISDAGLVPTDVDGVITYGLADTVGTSVVATDLGLKRLRHYADYNAGGNICCGVVTHAAMAVATGMADTVLVYRALNGSSGVRYASESFSRLLETTSIHSDAEAQFLDTNGISIPAHHFALLCRRHMIKYGTTQEHLAAVAMLCRRHAVLNERAMKREPMTLEDYWRAPWIAEPFRLYDCSLQSDGACALVVTTRERAKDRPHRPVYLMAGVTGSGPANRGLMWGNYWPDHTECYARYDCFTYSVIAQLEDFGFCPKGEGGPYVAEGHGELNGSLPLNTAGGLLSEAYIHGLNNVVEAVSQLRGDAGARQVQGAELALATGGGATSTGSAIILHN
jgi:acetyl-CoA acetyltransferase